MPSSRRPSSTSTRATIVRSTRALTSSWWRSASIAAAWAAALQKKGWRTWLTAVTNSSEPHSAKPTRRPAEAVDLREGPQQHDVAMALEQVERRVGVVEQVELAVGLVDDHADVAGAPARRRPRSRPPAARSIVGLFGLQTMTSRVAAVISARHRVEVVLVAVVEGNGDGGGARGGREVRVDAERRPRVDELGARARAAPRRPPAGCRTSRCRWRCGPPGSRSGRSARRAAWRWWGPDSGSGRRGRR